MAYGRKTHGAGRWLLLLAVALAVILVVAWRTGAFEGPPPNTREVYKTDTKDLSGGELIVRDTSTPAVPVTVPDVPMHNVQPGEQPSPSPSAS